MNIVKESRQAMDLPVRFSQVMLPQVAEMYDRIVPPELQEKYELANHGVKRMETMVRKGFLAEQDRESNLEHIIQGLGMAKEYMTKYPGLNGSINFAQVQVYLLMHDAGELAEKVGDVQPLGRTRREEARKRLEPIAARKAVFSLIPSLEHRQEVLGHYATYMRDDPRDMNVQMAHFIDKAQGTTRVAEVAFNQHMAQTEFKRRAIADHLWLTVPRMMEPAMHMLVYLPTQIERENIRSIVYTELGYLEKYSSPHVARTYMKGI